MTKSRAGTLLRSVLSDGALTMDDVARALDVTPGACDAFASGDSVMSPANQLCLAALVIDRVPRLARRAHSLRAQVAAATAYRAGQTEVHSSSPARWSDLRRS